MAFFEPNMTLWLPDNPDMNPVDYAVWGALREMVNQSKSFKSVQKLQSAIVAAWQQQYCHKHSLTEVSANDGVALKT